MHTDDTSLLYGGETLTENLVNAPVESSGEEPGQVKVKAKWMPLFCHGRNIIVNTIFYIHLQVKVVAACTMDPVLSVPQPMLCFDVSIA
ncbi:hypothetical protein Moror_10159 [Moniliophthora roreri MCA 2997]|uniref:Uncharacterized protein n=1 Tax=Moniliophthora roreri (strain MCA 2997) TaxID=1381753 RepID=V2WC27_MONRO|nr:hypothetical protein Moror_10159 [Moniliophthora roreri MCA 2997]